MVHIRTSGGPAVNGRVFLASVNTGSWSAAMRTIAAHRERWDVADPVHPLGATPAAATLQAREHDLASANLARLTDLRYSHAATTQTSGVGRRHERPTDLRRPATAPVECRRAAGITHRRRYRVKRRDRGNRYSR